MFMKKIRVRPIIGMKEVYQICITSECRDSVLRPSGEQRYYNERTYVCSIEFGKRILQMGGCVSGISVMSDDCGDSMGPTGENQGQCRTRALLWYRTRDGKKLSIGPGLLYFRYAQGLRRFRGVVRASRARPTRRRSSSPRLTVRCDGRTSH